MRIQFVTSPEVSIIIPCLNEEKHIGNVIKAIARQTFSLDNMEVLIADGGSKDKTREIIQSKINEFPELSIKIIDNPKKIIPAALNQAIMASKGEMIIRMDAHAIPDENYVKYWHIDHVIPCAKFNVSEVEEQQICFHWTNLCPMV